MQFRSNWFRRTNGTRLFSRSALVFALSLQCFVVLSFSAAVRRPPRAGRDAGFKSEGPALEIAAPVAIVFGFVGGFIRHDDPVHSEVQLAARLRKEYPAGVNIETFESYRGENARKSILKLLDANHDGKLTQEEKQHARIVLYGHSWGASEAINVARELNRDGIPVLLTIQVDSVSRFFQNDRVIPRNVAQAANFYQSDGLVHGQSNIRAADPTHTKVLGNFRFEYKAKSYECNEYPWYDHFFVRTHTQIECDRGVWDRAESLIREALAPTVAASANP